VNIPDIIGDLMKAITAEPDIDKDVKPKACAMALDILDLLYPEGVEGDSLAGMWDAGEEEDLGLAEAIRTIEIANGIRPSGGRLRESGSKKGKRATLADLLKGLAPATQSRASDSVALDKLIRDAK
jgi:hypothetical protein